MNWKSRFSQPDRKGKKRRPHSDIVKDVVRYLKRNHIFAFQVPRTVIPFDIIGCLTDGRFLAIGIKSANDKLSPTQEKFIIQTNTNNGLIFTVNDPYEVERRLKEAGYI